MSTNPFKIDTGLLIAAERYAAEVNSHGILGMVKDYKWWADLAIQQGTPESLACALSRERKLRHALVSNLVMDGQHNLETK